MPEEDEDFEAYPYDDYCGDPHCPICGNDYDDDFDYRDEE